MMTNDRRASQQADEPKATIHPFPEPALEKIPVGSRPSVIMPDDLKAEESAKTTTAHEDQYRREQAKSEIPVRRYAVKDGGTEIETPMGRYCLASDVLAMRRGLVLRAKVAEDSAGTKEILEEICSIISLASTPSQKLKRCRRKLFEARRDIAQLTEAVEKLSHRVRAQTVAMQAQADSEAELYRQLELARNQARDLEWFKAFDKLARAVHELMTQYPSLIVQSGESICDDEVPVSRDSFVALIGARDAVEAQKAQETTEEKKS